MDLARRLAGAVGMFKVGSQLFSLGGPRTVETLAALNDSAVFLDLKFHDIPNTVAGAVAAASGMPGVKLINVHALGGYQMMRAAARAPKRPTGRKPSRVIAVTILTSHDAASLKRVGILGSPEKRAVALARLARRAGLAGVVASGLEVAAIRRACGRDFLIVVPGVRPAAAVRGDQARVVTPAQAIRAGADYIVVGRPIIRARDPRAAAAAIVEEIGNAWRRRV